MSVVSTHCCFGVENEYALAIYDSDGERVDNDVAINRCLDVIRSRYQTLRCHTGKGVFLPSGGRAYKDRYRIEIATPEVTGPEICSYVLACHGLMGDVKAELLHDPHISQVVLHNCPIDYYSMASAGTHYSYHREGANHRPPIELACHFVALLAITGSGGFDGLRFCLSPRAQLLSVLAGAESSGRCRPLIDTYRKPLSKSGSRFQDLAADGNRAPLGIAIRALSTALLLQLIDSHLIDFSRLRLREPIRDLHAANVDPDFGENVELVTGERINLIELGRRICDLIGESMTDRATRMPDWAAELLWHWRGTLDALAECPSELDRTIDWRIMRQLLMELAANLDIRWDALGVFDEVHRILAARLGFSRPHRILSPDVLARTNMFTCSKARGLEPILRSIGATWDEFSHLLHEFPRLLELATRYHELGPDSMFEELRPGLRDRWPMVTSEDVRRAKMTSPTETRARLRGAFVNEHAGCVGYACDWQTLYHPLGTTSIDHPFSGRQVVIGVCPSQAQLCGDRSMRGNENGRTVAALKTATLYNTTRRLVRVCCWTARFSRA